MPHIGPGIRSHLHKQIGDHIVFQQLIPAFDSDIMPLCGDVCSITSMASKMTLVGRL